MSRQSTRRKRIARRAGARAASVLRDPPVLLAAALGAGVAWAVQLPLGAAAGVGGAMLAVAAAMKAWTTDGTDYVGSASGPTPRPGTDQAALVGKLRLAADQLADMVPTFAGTSLGSSVVEAATGASAAVESARRLAAATDAIDDALAELAAPISPRTERSSKLSADRQATAARLTKRRDELISRIEAAYVGAAEVRVKLLEVSAAIQAPSGDPAVDSGLAAVSDNLEALRRGLEELESTAAKPLPGVPPHP